MFWLAAPGSAQQRLAALFSRTRYDGHRNSLSEKIREQNQSFLRKKNQCRLGSEWSQVRMVATSLQQKYVPIYCKNIHNFKKKYPKRTIWSHY